MIIYDLTGLLSDLVQRGDGRHRHVPEQIASATDKDIEEVKAIIAGKEPALA